MSEWVFELQLNAINSKLFSSGWFSKPKCELVCTTTIISTVMWKNFCLSFLFSTQNKYKSEYYAEKFCTNDD